jgi:hypothetical protein
MFYFNLMLLQTGTKLGGGYDAWEKNKEGGRCRKLTPPKEKVSLFIFQTQFETLL